MSDEYRWQGENAEDPPMALPDEKNADLNGQGSYGEYRIDQKSSFEDRKKTEKKEGHLWRRLLWGGLTGLVLGTCFGAAFFGVGVFLDRAQEKLLSVEPLAEELPYAEAALERRDSALASGGDSASPVVDDIYGSDASVRETYEKYGAVAAVAQAAMPSVVAITSVSITEFQSFWGYTSQQQSTGTGSGIIIGENDGELLIATNNHVVEDASSLSVCFIGDDVINAENNVARAAHAGGLDIDGVVTANIKGTDAENDLAVIAVQKSEIPEETLRQIEIASLGDSNDLLVGAQVVAIGNALGYGQTVTSGWISALNRTVVLDGGASAELIQTDAAINPGNSGGALLNMKGEVIGINTVKYASSTVEGTGFAIPISSALPILEELMQKETRIRQTEEAGYMGVSLATVTTYGSLMYGLPTGALVAEVYEGHAAAQAGIERNDVIISFNGERISSKSELMDKMQYYCAGETVDVVVARYSQGGTYTDITIPVTLEGRTQ